MKLRKKEKIRILRLTMEEELLVLFTFQRFEEATPPPIMLERSTEKKTSLN
jgi:hypothetical protein